MTFTYQVTNELKAKLIVAGKSVIKKIAVLSVNYTYFTGKSFGVQFFKNLFKVHILYKFIRVIQI